MIYIINLSKGVNQADNFKLYEAIAFQQQRSMYVFSNTKVTETKISIPVEIRYCHKKCLCVNYIYNLEVIE